MGLNLALSPTNDFAEVPTRILRVLRYNDSIIN